MAVDDAGTSMKRFDLEGRRILVVEDDYFFAAEMAEAVRRAGGVVLGPVPDLSGALAIASGDGTIDGALLDISLGEETSFPIAKLLRDRGIPVLFITGYDSWFLPDELDDVPTYQKPEDADNVVRLLFRAPARED